MPAEYGENLSERELEVVALVAEGLTNREVAERLYLSPNTIKVHLRNIFTKTGVASRIELSMMAVKEGWVIVEEVAPETPPALEEEEEADTEALATSPIGETLPIAEASSSEHSAETEEIQLERQEPSSSSHAWPQHRTFALVGGMILALVILFLRPHSPGSADSSSSGPFEYHQTYTADDPFSDNGASVTGPDIPEDSWQELPPMPVRRAGISAVLLNEKIYAIGGVTNEGSTGRVDIYDIGRQIWITGTARPLAAAYITAVSLEDGSILVPGGCAQQIPSTTVHRYDPREDMWEEVAALPHALCAYALAALDGKVYLFGGWGLSQSNTKTAPDIRRAEPQESNYQALTYRYDPEVNTWERLTPPRIARAFGAAAALGDRLYYVGGYDGREELATCEVYDPLEDQWGTCARLLLPRGGLGLTRRGWRLYAVGGGWTNYLGFNEYYNLETDTWTLIETPLVGEWRNLGLVATETTLYALGGWHGDYLNRTYMLEIYSFHIFLPAIP